MTIAIDQVAPKVRALRFREKRGIIVIEFDMNVEGPEDCSQIFTPDTMQILQLPGRRFILPKQNHSHLPERSKNNKPFLNFTVLLKLVPFFI